MNDREPPDGGIGATGPDRPGSTLGTGAVPIAAATPESLPRWYRLPGELRQRAQWLLAAPDAKGDLKVPTSVNAAGELYPGSSTNRSTWLTFERAVEHARIRRLGIGYVLAADDPFCCVDIDVKNSVNAPDDPDIWTSDFDLQRFASMAYTFDSYTERSQSGVGLHIWCFGKIGVGCKRDGVELYSQERFIACTGDVWLDRPIVDRSEWLTNMASLMERQNKSDKSDDEILSVEEPQDVERTDQERYDQLADSQLGWKFVELWNGRWDQFVAARKAAKADPSQSAFDLELFGMLIFNRANCKRNREQAERMFRSSLMAANLDRKGRRDKQDRHVRKTLAEALRRQKVAHDAMITRVRDAFSSDTQAAWAAELAERERNRQRF